MLCSPRQSPAQRHWCPFLLTCSKGDYRSMVPLTCFVFLCITQVELTRAQYTSTSTNTKKKFLKVNKTELLKFVKKCTCNLLAKNQIRSMYGRLRCSQAGKVWGTRCFIGVMKTAHNLKKRRHHHTSHMLNAIKQAQQRRTKRHLYSKF